MDGQIRVSSDGNSVGTFTIGTFLRNTQLGESDLDKMMFPVIQELIIAALNKGCIDDLPELAETNKVFVNKICNSYISN